MAFRNQAAQNENLLIHTGDAGRTLKSDILKSSKKPLGKTGENLKAETSKFPKKQARKALTDVSNTARKQPLRNVSNLKENSVSKPVEKNAQKKYSGILTEEELKLCEEWEKEGPEYCGWTGTDEINMEKELMEKRIKEEVEMVFSSVHEWGNDLFDLTLPRRDESDDIGLKFQPELELLPTSPDRFADFEPELEILEDELDFPPVEFKIKDEYLK
ncbi:hypothetical protein LUZ60_004444 [Juncus effusus]|nr:hypothetical protein LUZ60_004444 [Juncus effusus]